MTYITPITERELRHLCQGTRRVFQPITNDNNDVLGFIDIILNETDLDIIIMNMKQTNQPFSSQLFKEVQKQYIIAKAKLSNQQTFFQEKVKKRTLSMA